MRHIAAYLQRIGLRRPYSSGAVIPARCREVAMRSVGVFCPCGIDGGLGGSRPNNSALKRRFRTLLFTLVVGVAMDSATAVAQEWAHTWGGSAGDSGSAVAVDPSSGAVYVTGSTSSFGAGGGDVLLLKYNSSGTLLWSRTWGGSGNEGGNGVVGEAVVALAAGKLGDEVERDVSPRARGNGVRA